MIDDALTNPPMPDWNDIPQDLRVEIMDKGRDQVCHCCQDAPFDIYHLIRNALKEREKRIFRATMDATSTQPEREGGAG
jgi:hypothetical protein